MFSHEKEIQELLNMMPPMITKPTSLLNNGDIDQKYEMFQEKAKNIFKKADEELYGNTRIDLF